MARRGIPTRINWYLREWMSVCGLSGRGSQAEMMRRTGWSKATMSQLYNNKQDYSPKVIEEASKALNLEPYELLMHPDKAMRLRRYIASAEEVVKIAHEQPAGEPEASSKDGTHG